eukprot:GDKJ01007620.1.p1 GENE.GDKJ01007620.1~~GDKJ01007620.1.p1  ORF type:complete len:436 (+),score=60.51 GDKJ01007620.1:122-1309(+)
MKHRLDGICFRSKAKLFMQGAISFTEGNEAHNAKVAQQLAEMTMAEKEGKPYNPPENDFIIDSDNPSRSILQLSPEEQEKRKIYLENAIKYWSMTAREFREALRLRPRDEDAKVLLEEAETEEANCIDLLENGGTYGNGFPAERLASHFHLCLKFWDDGKPSLAMQQAQLGVQLLKEFGLPLGCAAHNMIAIKQICNDSTLQERDRDTAARVAKFPDAVTSNYARAELLFDKRMLKTADYHMKDTRQKLLTRLRTEMHKIPPTAHPRDPPEVKAKCKLAEKQKADKVQKLEADLAGINEDIKFITQLRKMFCGSCIDSMPDANPGCKTVGGMTCCEGAQPAVIQLPPCLLSRFSSDCADQCKQWRQALLVAAPVPQQAGCSAHKCCTTVCKGVLQ